MGVPVFYLLHSFISGQVVSIFDLGDFIVYNFIQNSK